MSQPLLQLTHPAPEPDFPDWLTTLSPRLDVTAAREATGRQFWTPAMLNAVSSLPAPGRFCPAGDLSPLLAANHWIQTFTTRVVDKPAQGKDRQYVAVKWEAICPFVAPATAENLLFLSVAQPDDPADSQAIYREMQRYRSFFQTLAPTAPPQHVLRAVVVLFPQTPGDVLMAATNHHNTPLKSELIADGTMLGEFYPDNPFTATWQADFPVLQSPVPFYVLRTLIETDWRFIHREPAWRELYKARFGEPPDGDQYTFSGRCRSLAGRVIRRLGFG
ncbi:MAG: DUF6875 domain-containing protein [Candidatus Melainabacteria bacterium]